MNRRSRSASPLLVPESSGGLAQLGERYNGIVEVIGSSPLSSTFKRSRESRDSRGFFMSSLVSSLVSLKRRGQLSRSYGLFSTEGKARFEQGLSKPSDLIAAEVSRSLASVETPVVNSVLLCRIAACVIRGDAPARDSWREAMPDRVDMSDEPLGFFSFVARSLTKGSSMC